MPVGDLDFPQECSKKKKGEKTCYSFKGTYNITGSLGAFFIEEEAVFLADPIKKCVPEDEYDFPDISDDVYLDFYVQKCFRKKSKPKTQQGGAKKVWPEVEIANKKERVEKRLASKQLKRRGLPELEKKATSETTYAQLEGLKAGVKERKKSRWNKQLRHDKLNCQPVEGTGQVDCKAVTQNALTNESDMLQSTPFLQAFLQLQNRELTPEDYDLLLQLDDLVAKKTVDEDKLKSFREFLADKEVSTEQCAVCMEAYQVGEKIKELPCTHYFHAHCIEQWLKTVSLNCPLDGLPV